MKHLLGLTGAYCSGKNTVARLLEKLGWYCIDVDKLGHEALSQTIIPVSKLLGNDVRKADGSPDRRAIAGKVFGNPELLARYEAIVHPTMLELLDTAIASAPHDHVCINAAILYKLPQAARCQGILEVRSPILLRMVRGMRRDRLPLAAVLKKIRAQRSLFDSQPASVPVFIVANHGHLRALELAVLKTLVKMGFSS